MEAALFLFVPTLEALRSYAGDGHPPYMFCRYEDMLCCYEGNSYGVRCFVFFLCIRAQEGGVLCSEGLRSQAAGFVTSLRLSTPAGTSTHLANEVVAGRVVGVKPKPGGV